MAARNRTPRPPLTAGDIQAIEAAERILGAARDWSREALPEPLEASPALAAAARCALLRRRLEVIADAVIGLLDTLDGPGLDLELDDPGGTDLDAGELDEAEHEGDELENGEDPGYDENSAWRVALLSRITSHRNERG